ncbi:MAG: DUF4230 domain-containing protein [bacterium]|nr:DUF4230 domain-containing protein [bacterium]
MKKFLKRFFSFLLMLVFAFALVQYGPNLYVRFFGEKNARWISERFSETLKEKNELVVYEIETTGQETVTQDAWLLGTVQKVELPYSFQMSFTVDLSSAKVDVAENVIKVRVPSPEAGYQKLTVDENNIRKNDWLYPLTPERYEQIKRHVENKLYDEYSVNQDYCDHAWNVTVHNLQKLFRAVTDQSLFGDVYEIQIIQDDSLLIEK